MPKSVLPVFNQLSEDLRKQIESGQLRPGDMIPSESQLGSIYGASRMTVRRGLALLVADGLIETVHGKGNFVAQPKLNQATLIFEDNNFFNKNGLKFKLLGIKRVEADDQTAAKLNLQVGTKVFELKRLIYGDNRLLAIDKKFLPYLKGKPIVENEIEYAAFPEMVAKHHDTVIDKIEVQISATTFESEEAQLLDVAPGHPALRVIQVIYAKNEKPLGMSKVTYRADMYELKAVSYPYSGRK